MYIILYYIVLFYIKVACLRALVTSAPECFPTGCNSTRRKPSLCGARWLVDSTIFQTIRWRWVWISFNPSNLSVISVFTLIQICRCGRIWHELYPAASQFKAEFAASVDQSDRHSMRLPARLMEGLQSILDDAARLVFGSREYEHVTPFLHGLHCFAPRHAR